MIGEKVKLRNRTINLAGVLVTLNDQDFNRIYTIEDVRYFDYRSDGLFGGILKKRKKDFLVRLNELADIVYHYTLSTHSWNDLRSYLHSSEVIILSKIRDAKINKIIK
jgi:hypothetical protein